MPVQLEIDFISDVACPWCAIGLASLDEALRRASDAISADLRFQPFELNPDIHPGGENIDAFLGSRYGSGASQLASMRDGVRARATAVGFAFNQDASSRIYNTFDAHRLLHWARQSGQQGSLKRALFKANFSDNADVSNHEVLAAAAVDAGLDADEARRVLASDRYAQEVREAEQLWTSRGIHAVPAVVVNGKWLIPGGQPPETFEGALRRIAGEIASAAKAG